MANFTGTAAADSLIGGDTEADVFRFTPLTLQPGDTISGGAGAFEDALRFTAGGTIAAAALGGVSGVERIDLHDAGNSITLPAALVLSAGGTLTVIGGLGADRIDAGLLLDPTLRLVVTTGTGGADTVIGGAGADSVTLLGASTGRSVSLGGGDDTVTASIAALGATDVVQGGAGRDRLALASAGAWQAAALVGLGSIEEIAFPNIAGTTLQVSDALANQADGDALTIIGNGQDQTVDASGVLSPRAISFLAGRGTDSVLGGAGADTVESSGTLLGTLGAGQDTLRLLSAATAASSTISGGVGNDTLLIGKKGEWVLGAGLTGFETVELLAARIRLTLNGTEGLEVLGSSGADYVILGAARQAFHGFEGDDTVVLTAAMLPGVSLSGGAQTGRDTIIITGGGTMDLRRAFITGFERLEVETGGVASTLFLSNQPMDVLLRGAATVYLGTLTGQSVFGSSGGETFYLGAAGQVLLARGGSDFIQARAGDLVAGTMIDGGNDFDQLDIIGGGTVNLRSGALVQNVERITLNDSTALILDAASDMRVTGSGGNDTVSTLAGDITGDLGNGDDVLEIPLNMLAAAPGASSMTGGSGTDTLRVTAGGPSNQTVVLPTRFAAFEVLDLGGVGSGQMLDIQDVAARTIIFGAATGGLIVRGGGGNETFQLGTFGRYALGRDGNDTIIGADGQGILDGGAGNDSIYGAGGGDQIYGGLGRDTLRGGDGSDVFYIGNAAELADWAVNPRTIVGSDGGPSVERDELVILASGTGAIDFTTHSISYINRISIGHELNLTLTLTDAMVATADQGAFGGAGRLEIGNYLFATANLVINAGALTAGRAISTFGPLNGHDSMQGGAGADGLNGSSGNDTLKGGADNDVLAGGDGIDELRGEAGNDTIRGEAGADSIWGDDGGDLIQLGAGDLASDRIAYNSPTNGSTDINTTVAVGTADQIQDFTARASAADTVGDWIAVSRTGLGLNGGNDEIVLANGEAWNAALYSVFVVHSLDTLGDAPGAADFGNFALVAAGVNLDAGAKSGFTAGRTVLFALSNGEGVATRQTGLYRWADDGDGLLESTDDLRLLAVIDGVSTAGFSTETIVLA